MRHISEARYQMRLREERASRKRAGVWDNWPGGIGAAEAAQWRAAWAAAVTSWAAAEHDATVPQDARAERAAFALWVWRKKPAHVLMCSRVE